MNNISINVTERRSSLKIPKLENAVQSAGTVTQNADGSFRFTVSAGAGSSAPNPNALTYIVFPALDERGNRILLSDYKYTKVIGVTHIEEKAVTSSNGGAYIVGGFVNDAGLLLGSVTNGVRSYGVGIKYTLASGRQKIGLVSIPSSGGSTAAYSATGSADMKIVKAGFPEYSTQTQLYYAAGHGYASNTAYASDSGARLDVFPSVGTIGAFGYDLTLDNKYLHCFIAAGRFDTVSATQTIDVLFKYNISAIAP